MGRTKTVAEGTLPHVSFYRLENGEWGVAGPPDCVQVGDLEVLTKDKQVVSVKVLKTSPVLRNKHGQRYRVGYLQPVLINPDKIVANLEALANQIAHQQKKLDKLNNRLARLITAVRRQMAG